MHMEVHQLRYFCAVARRGSFTRAAEDERIAQPSLSQQILKLEAELGAPLFERRGRTVRLTPCGELLLPQAQEILRRLTCARQSVQALVNGVHGRLAVGAIPTVMPYFLAPRAPEFTAEFPEVDLRLVENTTPRLIEALQSGDIDLAVVALPIASPDMICSELFREPVLAALPPQHPLAAAEVVDFSALRQEKMLLLREGHCFRDNALEVCRKARIRSESIFESDQLASIFAMVASGVGISLAPAMAAGAAASCRLLPLRRPVHRRIGYIHARRQFHAHAETAFTDWLRRLTAPLREKARSESRRQES